MLAVHQPDVYLPHLNECMIQKDIHASASFMTVFPEPCYCPTHGEVALHGGSLNEGCTALPGRGFHFDVQLKPSRVCFPGALRPLFSIS